MKVLIEELVRAVVWHAIRHYAELDDVVTGAIADRAAKELAGAVVDPADIVAIRRRITSLTLAPGLPREAWSELCHLDTALSQLIGAAPVAVAIERAARAVTGHGAAELTARLNEAVRVHQDRRTEDDDTVVVDVELGGES